jgi:hypothetical protein
VRRISRSVYKQTQGMGPRTFFGLLRIFVVCILTIVLASGCLYSRGKNDDDVPAVHCLRAFDRRFMLRLYVVAMLADEDVCKWVRTVEGRLDVSTAAYRHYYEDWISFGCWSGARRPSKMLAC